MIRLKDLLKETEEAAVSLQNQVTKWFDSNKKKLEKLLDDDDIDGFYELGFDKFPDADQDDIAQFMNNCAKMQDWFADEEVAEMPEEKDLETAAFGDKKLQKGVNMGDYNKKMKSPKESPTDLVVGDLKKLKESTKKKS
jgi:DNA-directed RNA polymerase alpha subunit